MGTPVAIVGSGMAGLVAYATLRHGGLQPEEVVVLGPQADPAAPLRARAAAIRQRRMRSESDGHCLPRSFPGLAVRAAARRRSAVPLLQTVCNRYLPTVEEFFGHVEEVRARSGWAVSHRQAWVERISAVPGGFAVDGQVFPHVVVAVGHAGLAVPEEYAGDPRTVHAYQPHDYAPAVAVVGAGMAAAMEWHNALAAGSLVVSVRRREPARQPLSLPRPMFSKRGLARFQATSPAERELWLRRLSFPSYPPGRRWDEPLARAAREGRFRVATGREAGPVDQVICATGFRSSWRAHPVLRRLVDEHDLATVGDWLVLGPDSTVPALTDGERTLAIAGVAGRYAYPAADTVAGARYVARRFLTRVQRCPTR